jgi:hypothetical protein
MIVITHVYSRRSAGDGLLLDLTLALLERAVPGFRRGHQLTLSKAIEERKPSSREP